MLLKLIFLCSLFECFWFNEVHSLNTTLSAITDDDDTYLNATEFANYVEVKLPEKLVAKIYQMQNGKPSLKQFPSNPLTMVAPTNSPCTCTEGLCACCTGMLLQSFPSKGCMNLKYIPEDFSFEFKMKMNDIVLYKNKLSGRNPKPVCISPARIPFIDVCAKFSDIYFVGRNMHICLDINASFDDFELYSRSFDCMRLGDQGIKLVKPEEGGGLPVSVGNDAVVDAGTDTDEYDDIL